MDWRNIPADFVQSCNSIMHKMRYCPECGKRMNDSTEEGDRLNSMTCPDDHANISWGEDRLGNVSLTITTDDTVMIP